MNFNLRDQEVPRSSQSAYFRIYRRRSRNRTSDS